jgi:hypothetical protein
MWGGRAKPWVTEAERRVRVLVMACEVGLMLSRRVERSESQACRVLVFVLGKEVADQVCVV